jgi:protein-L-isoaspartate(D-aspartate) O-methyltransferase
MSWAVWINGRPATEATAIALAAAARLRSRGESVVVLRHDRVQRAVARGLTVTGAQREALDRALAYMAATLVDSGIPVIIDAPGCSGPWSDLVRLVIPRFAEVRLSEGESAQVTPPELLVDTATQGTSEAAAAVVELVRRRFLRARAALPETRSLGDAALRRHVLLEESEEQKEISRRALVYTAELLGDGGARRRRVVPRLSRERQRMVDTQIAARGVRDLAVLGAMRTVHREDFLPEHLVPDAYGDEPLPIGEGQTISQPYVVAAMTAALRLEPGNRVLEIGTGSGYAAAVLAVIAAEVYTIERIESLAEAARVRLVELGYTNVHVRCGDGTLGWPEGAPFDAIAVTAGGPDVPRSLLQQLAVGGRLVMPVGPTPRFQRLVRVVRIGPERFEREELEDVAFVPLIGAEGWPAGS